MHENAALKFEIAVYMHRKRTNRQPYFADLLLRSQNTGTIHTFELRATKTYVKSMYNRLSVHIITDIGRIPLSNAKICVEGESNHTGKARKRPRFPCFFAPILCFFDIKYLVVA